MLNFSAAQKISTTSSLNEDLYTKSERLMRWLSKLQMLPVSQLRWSRQWLHLEDFTPNGCRELTSRCYLLLLVWAKSCQNRKPDYNGTPASARGCTRTSGNTEYSTHRDDNRSKNLEGRNCDFAFKRKVCWWRADALKQSEHSKLCQNHCYWR